MSNVLLIKLVQAWFLFSVFCLGALLLILVWDYLMWGVEEADEWEKE